MKKIATGLMTACLLLMFYPQKSNASTTDAFSFVVSDPEESAKTEAEAKAEAKVKALLFRLNEIKTMDKSNLKPSDKKELRIEVRSIKQEIREMYRGQYLSAGTRIMIELLLII